ncbi:MAG: protein phosphatase 2C domain-containing protein [Xanthomonadales bacterium]|nr:protein phosphatase 2C domain-containing protein [Xanthomonadales bacterium]
MTFKSSATTHVGMVRKVNQDSYAERTDIGVWAVADGMGGHEAGEIASATVTDFIKKLEPNDNIEEMLAAVQQSIMDANNQLTEQAASYDSQRVPGSTVVALIINGDRGALVWAGDSRIYRRRDQVVTQLTRDHSHVQDLVEQGVILESEAESHPMANVITRAVGISEPLELDSAWIEVRSDDQFLLCSDGLSRLVSNEEMESMMANMDSEEVSQSLLHTALVRGARDNVTLICVKNCDETDKLNEQDDSTVIHNAASLDELDFDFD